jgi:hypothetical protein
MGPWVYPDDRRMLQRLTSNMTGRASSLRRNRHCVAFVSGEILPDDHVRPSIDERAHDGVADELLTDGTRKEGRRTTFCGTCGCSGADRRSGKIVYVRRMGPLLLVTIVSAMAAYLALGRLLRSSYLRWGATAEEVRRTLPGDQLVPIPAHSRRGP